ncbi:hypothetical protein PAXRUDRAFT_162603 [Paxillus rubicundulus Ve08.2h10]|uniref:Uncharacterized protein n=1 Tax=Paxillus rubicundulus Ve08.2h10 TaxID=930991 RepID=A0A0D0C7R8_9AGAM|nr:hypothetical protein PAXRUDRAFT_162603 [Paxillus rubicundulus Ve08.2h10]
MDIGDISLTCDMWQASNADAYFVVTDHWIKEYEPGAWELESAVLGFMQMNNSHNGLRLGQALFKICERLCISHKVDGV